MNFQFFDFYDMFWYFIFLCIFLLFVGFLQVFVLSDSIVGYIVEDMSIYMYEMICVDFQVFQQCYLDIVYLVDIGWLEFGLEVKVVRIGRQKVVVNFVFLVGNIYVWEDFFFKLLMKFMNGWLFFIEGIFDVYLDVGFYFDFIDVYVLLVVNFDGMKIVQYDFDGIFDLVNVVFDSIYCVEGFFEWKVNGKGVDLNCLFDDGNWEVKVGDGFQLVFVLEGYKGIMFV